MTDFIWPTSIVPARSEITLRDLSSRFVSPFTGTSRTYSRPGGEILSLTLALPPLKAERAAALRGLLAKLRGGVNRVWCKDHSYVRRGSFPATELLANNTFAGGVTGWLTSSAAGVVADSVYRVTLTGNDGYVYQNAATVSGRTYVGRMITQNSVVPAKSCGVYLDNPSGTSGSSSSAGAGYRAAAVTAAGSSVGVASTLGSGVSGDFYDLAYASFARCALIAGGSQTGSRLVVDALPASTNGLLLEGDQVQIGEELLTVAAPLNSDGSGTGYLTLHRPLRSVPADNAPVIIHEPMGLFMLAENENGWENSPGRFANASVSLIEAPR